jgi:hypothetical protein
MAHLTENIGPRSLGSPQAEAAAEYVAAEMRKLGPDAKLEAVHVPKWTRGIETGELVEYSGQAPGSAQRIVLTALGGNAPTTADGITTEVVVARNYNELERIERDNAVGKVVLFNGDNDKLKAVANYTPEAYGEVAQYREEAQKLDATENARG